MRIAALALAVSALTLAASPALARCDAYGNCYDSYGSTTRGYNSYRGNTWFQQNDSSGQRGYDSRGNYYDYDRRTGTYYNYGTGETRTYEPYSGRRRNW